MDSILSADFDIDNPCNESSSAPSWARGDYYAKVTKFLNGGAEVVMRVVRPMSQAAMAEQFENGYPVSMAPKPEKSASEIEAEKAANHRRAVRKAVQTVRFLCNQMHADRLLTLTYRANQEDREQVKIDFKQFLKYVRHGWAGVESPFKSVDWRYVAVLERQGRGAYHVHIAVQGYQPIKFIRACWYKALGAPGAVGVDTPGQVDITSPRMDFGSSRKREWATHRLASYISKYMSETFDESSFEKKRYWRAKDIERPVAFRHWLVATSMGDAIKELVADLAFSEGIQLKKHWLSDDGTCYWFRGVYETGD